VRLPASLEARLYDAARRAARWADRVAAVELLGSVAAPGPELLECLARALADTSDVRAAALRVAARLRDPTPDFIQGAVERLHDESGVVAYAMGRVLKNAFLDGQATPADRERIIRALAEAKDGERARRTVYFDHHARIPLPQLPRLDQHFARLVAGIWLGDQAATLQQSQSGWARPQPEPARQPAAATV
jgi:hypothetical protein